MISGSLRRKTASRIALRASSSAARWSASERHCILRLLASFEHAQLAALLDAIVHVAPETHEILSGRNQGADHHEPEKNEPKKLKRGMPRCYDNSCHSTDLQDHLGLTESGCFDCETLCRRDVPKPEDREFAPDDDDHHPGRNKRLAVHSAHGHEGDEGGGNQ